MDDLSTAASSRKEIPGSDVDGSNSPIVRTYLDRTEKSRAQIRAASALMPDGHTRISTHWAPYPIVTERAEGTQFWDIDGNRYTDLIYNYTCLFHGHAYPPATEAVARQLRSGTCWAGGNMALYELAELLVTRIDAVDKIIFTNSGSEAANAALGIARAATGRRKILMARRGYHGSIHEVYSGMIEKPGPDTLVASYNDTDDFLRVIEAHRDEICAIFLEPVMGSGGVVQGTHEFLSAVQKAAREIGALFVIDEVMSLRLGMGGLHQDVGLDPDLVMMGKIIGGGFPVGAVGGKAEVMDLLSGPDRKLSAAGTFSGNPVTMTAGLALMRDQTPEQLARMDRLAGRLTTELEAKAAELGVYLRTKRVGDLFNFYLGDGPVSAMGGARADDGAQFHIAALNHGVLMAPRGMACLASIWDDALVDATVERLSAALADLARES